MPEKSIRFGVTDHKGFRAATWKCWTLVGTGKADVYLACRELQGTLKLSLHETGRWHTAFDYDRFFSLFESDQTPPSRFLARWGKPAPLVEGLTLACRVHTPWYAVTVPVPSLDDSVAWIQAAPRGQSIEVALFLSDAGMPVTDWPGRNSMNTHLVGALDLDNGDRVWAVHHAIPLAEPKLPPTVAPRYFKGAGDQDLLEGGKRMIVCADYVDGSVAFFEAPVSFAKNERS